MYFSPRIAFTNLSPSNASLAASALKELITELYAELSALKVRESRTLLSLPCMTHFLRFSSCYNAVSA